jgi:nicotinamidase/pyrazinamidase
MVRPLDQGDVLLVVDVQNDFCTGGSLPVPMGEAVVPELNHWIAAAVAGGATVCASRDWHPPGHTSFRERGGPWPPHCVRDTRGAALRSDLHLPASVLIVDKGVQPDRDNYSAFDGTGLAERLRATGVTRVWVGGLALDYCVLATALDSVKEGFETHLLLRASRPVDVTLGDGDRAVDRMVAAGVLIEH